jgi:DNA mismatch repair protein MutL
MPTNHSDTRIKKLSPLLINQLAAGEVVTRPAAVVKELLENAIDAGATNIEVHITQGGMGMIEVGDNGVGIHPDDMVMAITRHATSKVADVANLHGIMTLGFRGEALAATAAVSRLTLTSSHDNSGIGRQLQVAGVLDDTPTLLPVVHNRGTTITVRDLYFNVPARRGNLKSIATEFGHIETIVREVALARADITLMLFHDNKKRLSLSASTTHNEHNNRLSLARLEQAIGSALTKNAIEVAVDLSSLTQPSSEYDNNKSANHHAGISGWLWPMRDQKESLPKLIYVNGRLVKEALISNQLRQLAQGAQLTGMGYALYFDMPTHWLNINVHPSKQRIKISPLNNVMAHLNHALRSKLKAFSATERAVQPETTLPNRHVSTSKSLDTTLPKTSAIHSLVQSGQVQSPKRRYQPSVTTQLSECEAVADFEAPSHQKMTIARAATPTDLNDSLIETIGVHCLDIIANLDESVSESLMKEGNEGEKRRPWLLFYSEGQCLLISADVWRLKVSGLFESRVFSNRIVSNEIFKKDKMSNSVSGAREINQQLAIVSAQMSGEDLRAFNTDIKELLFKHAIKTIDSNRLVALMLSATH